MLMLALALLQYRPIAYDLRQEKTAIQETVTEMSILNERAGRLRNENLLAASLKESARRDLA